MENEPTLLARQIDSSGDRAKYDSRRIGKGEH